MCSSTSLDRSTAALAAEEYSLAALRVDSSDGNDDDDDLRVSELFTLMLVVVLVSSSLEEEEVAEEVEKQISSSSSFSFKAEADSSWINSFTSCCCCFFRRFVVILFPPPPPPPPFPDAVHGGASLAVNPETTGTPFWAERMAAARTKPEAYVKLVLGLRRELGLRLPRLDAAAVGTTPWILMSICPLYS